MVTSVYCGLAASKGHLRRPCNRCGGSQVFQTRSNSLLFKRPRSIPNQVRSVASLVGRIRHGVQTPPDRARTQYGGVHPTAAMLVYKEARPHGATPPVSDGKAGSSPSRLAASLSRGFRFAASSA